MIINGHWSLIEIGEDLISFNFLPALFPRHYKYIQQILQKQKQLYWEPKTDQ